MKKNLNLVVLICINILSSKKMFYFVVFLLLFQALWIAFSFRYSMIFDEYYHFELIQYFSHQILPFIYHQAPQLDQYGALDRNPNLLFHYILSFPYRIIAMFTDNLAVQIITMRIVNICLFAVGLVLYARIFQKMKIKQIFINVTSLFFVLLPIVPFVAATINYDNLVFLLIPLMILLAIRITDWKPNVWSSLVLFVTVGMCGSLVKTAFAPFFVAAVIYLILTGYQSREQINLQKIKKSINTSSVFVKISVILVVVVVGGFFVERYGVNVIKYHSLNPGCSKQINEKRCLSNLVAQRDNYLHGTRDQRVPVMMPAFVSTWTNYMTEGLFRTGANTNGNTGTQTGAPLPLVYTTTVLVGLLGLIIFIYKFDSVKKTPYFWLIILGGAVYVFSLFMVNMQAYYNFRTPVAIQARYLVPILPFVIMYMLYAINLAFRKNQSNYKLIVLILVFLPYLNGAGLITHIVRSNESWNWDNRTVRNVNNETRDALKPLIKELWYDKNS